MATSSPKFDLHALSIGDAIRWLKLGQRRSSGDVREQAEASAMLESATQGIYMFYNSFGGVAGMSRPSRTAWRDERNRQRALQDGDGGDAGGAVRRGPVLVLRRGEGRATGTHGNIVCRQHIFYPAAAGTTGPRRLIGFRATPVV